MISIVIPSYNPDINKFKNAFNSALETKTNEIIIIDDFSNRDENVEYFKFLEDIDRNNERVKVIYNNENKGRFLNSLFALHSATNDYVKKLDCDDEINSVGFNNLIDEKHNSDIIMTKYFYKNKKRNKSNDPLKWNIFNGSVIYKKSMLIDINLDNTPKNFFGDIIFIMHIISKSDSKISFSYEFPYKYMEIGSTTPKQIIKKYEDWKKGYFWVKNNSTINTYSEYTLEKLDIFYELLCLRKREKFSKTKYKNFKSFNFTPKFFKKVIAYFVFKF